MPFPQIFKPTAEETIEITLPANTFASAIKIEPLGPESEVTTLKIDDVEVKACFEEKTTTVTTTAAGTTTVITTTQLTPTGITTTTVKSTPGEHTFKELTT